MTPEEEARLVDTVEAALAKMHLLRREDLTDDEMAPWRHRKVLVLCQKGNSRSVGMATLLKDIGADALAAGVETASRPTMAMLAAWAERIIIMSARFVRWVPEEHREKVALCEVGTDTYWRGVSQRLEHQCVAFLQADAATSAVDDVPREA